MSIQDPKFKTFTGSKSFGILSSPTEGGQSEKRRHCNCRVVKGIARHWIQDMQDSEKMNPNQNQFLRNIPSIDRLLNEPEVLNLTRQTSRPFVASLLRKVLCRFRQDLIGGIAKDSGEFNPTQHVVDRLKLEFRCWTEPALRKVINATGVILHTNLGRAPVSQKALENLKAVAGHYSNLEFDLDQGSRGKRDVFADRLLQELLGCERAIVVNNCAAALFLSLNTLAEGGEVLISRGELIEIGDSFRIPDILRKSGALLREVGTTNKTKLSDYTEAINERTRMILRVHASNFRIVGFSSKPSLEELLKLAREKSIPLMEDLGSGCLIDLKLFGIDDEPDPRSSLKAGAALVSFSGDKLLGGPQAGILAGQELLIQRLRRNPLFRALRVDKLTLGVLETTLIAYLKQREAEEIPLVRMIHTPVAQIEGRARSIISQLPAHDSVQVEMLDGQSVLGGGSTPDRGIPSKLISIHSASLSPAKLEARLRMSVPPVLSRVEHDRLLLDLRTVFPEDDVHLLQTLSECLRQSG
jgi:L-seryl-tRNA(Ser) seleniumtransferase